ncbi:CG4570 [Drosophila busckii]|uniref:CG4570 n=1 Tax=Drosophila busckii TaxID=30019 RepID=A0A0M3QXX0_DROBS|nr:uncharacterized protein LOC108603321 [Drosophila busckii]ALC46609.1 CG4570 [Drosophila busckii]
MVECDMESVMNYIKDGELSKLKLRPLAEVQGKREVGRPKVFENRKLVEHMLYDHPHYTSIDVQRELLNKYGIEVSRRTLQRRISEIRARQAVVTTTNQSKIVENPGLSIATRQRRLEWAHAHEDWTVRDWRNIFNMDDFKAIGGDEPKEIFVDTLIGPDCPECNDLNLLEQLMAIIEPKIQQQAPETVAQFRAVLYEIWHSDQDMVNQIEQLYESMTWRVRLVIQNGGNETEFF